MSKMHEVSEKFILDAHRLACQDWKRKIEDYFPEVFEVSIVDKIHACLCTQNYKVLHKGYINSFKHYILIRLPNANKEWSYEAFDFAKQFCKMNTDFYPIHGTEAYDVSVGYVVHCREESKVNNYLVLKS
jgi:hypothetical protein